MSRDAIRLSTSPAAVNARTLDPAAAEGRSFEVVEGCEYALLVAQLATAVTIEVEVEVPGGAGAWAPIAAGNASLIHRQDLTETSSGSSMYHGRRLVTLSVGRHRLVVSAAGPVVAIAGAAR